MRTTVGPLPPAVYWRRRAVVLGALLLGVIVLFVSCTNSDDGKTRATNASSQRPIPAPAHSEPTDEPSFSDARPGTGRSLPAPGDLDPNQPNLGDNPTSTASAPTGSDQNVTAPSGDFCTDAEMSVTPVAAAATVKRGAPVGLRLKIKNIGSRTCKRDVGADPQELYIDQGARKYWSSDTCGRLHGSSVETFAPGAEREFSITWNGRQTSKCEAGMPAGPTPIPGQYEVRGRLATKISEPFSLTIVA